MIGRAAQGRPWIFREINHFLTTGECLPSIDSQALCDILTEHLHNLHEFYGEFMGVRIARKHIGWYCKTQPGSEVFRKQVNQVDSAQQQLGLVKEFFMRIREGKAA